MTSRIHLTNGKERTTIKLVNTDHPHPGRKEQITYDVTYCNQIYSTFSKSFKHSVYLVSALQKIIDQGVGDQLCPDCLASEEYAMDMLAKLQ